MRRFVVFALLLSQVSLAQTPDPVVTKILDLARPGTTIFLGEAHTVVYHKELFQRLVADPRSNFDVIATEMVAVEDNAAFNAYLVDAAAIPYSQVEAEYLEKFAPSKGWKLAKDESGKNVVRALRELKLTRGEKVKVCGIDGPGVPRNERFKLFESFPAPIQALIRTVYPGKSQLEISQVDENWDREAQMGIDLHSCVQGASRVLVFGGIAHFKSVNMPRLNDSWEYATGYYSALDPSVKLITIGIGVESPQTRAGSIANLVRMNAKDIGVREERGFYSLNPANDFAPTLLDDGKTDLSKFFDYWIFGPDSKDRED